MSTCIFNKLNLSKFLLPSVLSLTVLISGCSNRDGNSSINNEDMGGVIGGIAGGIIGNQVGHGSGKTAATIAGAMVGAIVGNQIGNRMDKVDAMNVNSALESQRDNRTSTWVNPNTNTRYKVTPTATVNEGGRPCRDYKMQAIIDGKSEFINGRACRVNGKWIEQ